MSTLIFDSQGKVSAKISLKCLKIVVIAKFLTPNVVEMTNAETGVNIRNFHGS